MVVCMCSVREADEADKDVVWKNVDYDTTGGGWQKLLTSTAMTDRMYASTPRTGAEQKRPTAYLFIVSPCKRAESCTLA